MRFRDPSQLPLPGLLAAGLLLFLALSAGGPRSSGGVRAADGPRPGGGALPAAARVDGPAVQEACDADEHRQFDFWRGSWDVYADGELAGGNEIRPVAGGCALEESWSGAGGSRGTSLNYYDPDDGRWHQLWVGSGGLVLRLTGGLEDGSMVLEGERTAEGRRIRDRITWSPLGDGEVRQLWEVSPDGGESWSPTFDGRYRRR